MWSKKFQWGLITAFISIICIVASFYMLEAFKPEIGIFLIYLCLFFLGCSAYLFQADRTDFDRSDFYGSIALVAVILISTIYILILQLTSDTNFSLQEWLGIILFWYFIIMVTYPVFHNYRKKKRTRD